MTSLRREHSEFSTHLVNQTDGTYTYIQYYYHCVVFFAFTVCHFFITLAHDDALFYGRLCGPLGVSSADEGLWCSETVLISREHFL